MIAMQPWSSACRCDGADQTQRTAQIRRAGETPTAAAALQCTSSPSSCSTASRILNARPYLFRSMQIVRKRLNKPLTLAEKVRCCCVVRSSRLRVSSSRGMSRDVSVTFRTPDLGGTWCMCLPARLNACRH